MKIGVIGPDITVDVIRAVAKKSRPDLDFIYLCSEFYEESADSARRLQTEYKVDAILFSGPTNYAYARKRTDPAVPWAYISHSRAAAMQAILKALVTFHNNLQALSVDLYEPELFEAILEDVGIPNTVIYTPPFGSEVDELEKKLLEFHRQNYYSGRANICFTRVEHVLGPLTAEGIPCIRINTTEEDVERQLYYLQAALLSTTDPYGRMGAIHIHFDYNLDEEQNISVREWEKMKYQNMVKELVYAAAQQMQAAVFSEGWSSFDIMTTRQMMMDVFLNHNEHQKLLQAVQFSSNCRIWIGMGTGRTPLEAKARAAMALNHSVANHSGTSYLAEDDHQVTGPLNYTAPRRSPEYFAHRLSIGVNTLKKLRDTILDHGDTMTSESLASHLGITERSANRILLNLEKEGCTTIVGKQAREKGRPARIHKITLPASLF